MFLLPFLTYFSPFPSHSKDKEISNKIIHVFTSPLYIKEYNRPALESALLGEVIHVPTSKTYPQYTLEVGGTHKAKFSNFFEHFPAR